MTTLYALLGTIKLKMSNPIASSTLNVKKRKKDWQILSVPLFVDRRPKSREKDAFSDAAE